MSKRLFTELRLLYSRDTAQRQKLLDEKFTVDELNDVTNNANEMVTRHFELAAGAVDEEVTLDKITSISTLMIVAEQEVEVKINGVGSPSVPVRPIPADTTGNAVSEFARVDQPGLVLWRGKIDSLHLSNPNGVDLANVTVFMVGDATGAGGGGATVFGAPRTLSWSLQSKNTIAYAGGFYDFFTGDDDFATPTVFGDANVAKAAHFFLVTGAVNAAAVTVRVTGTSITDAGVQTVADTEDIVIAAGAANRYLETSKKWNGSVSTETVSGTPITCNYGWSKYHDLSNQDFEVLGLEALWVSDSTDSSSNIELLHHTDVGWTFNSGADPTPPAAIASRNVDHAGNITHHDGQMPWKRVDLAQTVLGADSEGILFRVTSGSTGPGNLSFRNLNIELTVRTAS